MCCFTAAAGPGSAGQTAGEYTQNENRFNEPQGHRGSSHNAAPIAQSSTLNSASQGTSWSSRHSPAVGCSHRCRQGQRAWTRSHSPLQRWAPDSLSQPRTCRGSRQAPIRTAAHTATPDRAHQGPQSIPQQLMEAGPGSQGGPGLEAPPSTSLPVVPVIAFVHSTPLT